jgi:hypothetical protein
MKLPPQVSAVARQSGGPSPALPPGGVGPGRHLRQDELAGYPPFSDPTRANVHYIGCHRGKHWCKCPTSGGFQEAYECCPNTTSTCAFNAQGTCVCA